MNSSIFVGDLNKMKSGLTVTENVYHIKNIGDLVTKIEVTKKISDHPMLIYQKQVSFAKLPNPKQIKVFDKHILNRNLLELDYTIKQKSYVPKFQQPETN